MEASDARQEAASLEIVVGRVIAVEDHAGARAPGYRVTVHLGPRGRRHGNVPLPHYPKQQLLGRQVVCVLGGDDVAVLGAHSHAAGIVLLQPEREVEDGTIVA